MLHKVPLFFTEHLPPKMSVHATVYHFCFGCKIKRYSFLKWVQNSLDSNSTLNTDLIATFFEDKDLDFGPHCKDVVMSWIFSGVWSTVNDGHNFIHKCSWRGDVWKNTHYASFLPLLDTAHVTCRWRVHKKLTSLGIHSWSIAFMSSTNSVLAPTQGCATKY